MAVFVPMAFFPGSTGAIYRQFSVTLIISIGFSALMALSLTPALCATFLKTHLPEDQRKRGWFMDRFGRLFGDRKSVVKGKSVSVRVDLGGRRLMNTKNRA